MMQHLIRLSTFLVLFCVANPTWSISEEEMSPEQLEKLMQEWPPLEVTGDAIAWQRFAATKEVETCSEDAEGYTNCILSPDYSEDIKQLDGTEVTLMGYMFPLQDKAGQTNFLFGPYPLSCPFHYHVGPAQIVEILASEPVAFSYDPITVKGTLRVRFNTETEVFYYLEDAQPV